jgi:anti-sigma regulatory factor (Ser/Thr protein kinase)
MTVERPEVRLSIPARAEGVGVVRQALTGLAEALAIDATVLSDMKMAVTEACTNVVVHAYAKEGDSEADGTLDVDVLADEISLTVFVRDRGAGMHSPDSPSGKAALGLGLPLIAALSDDWKVSGPDGGGTEVRMRFLYTRSEDPVDANPIAETGWEPPGSA